VRIRHLAVRNFRGIRELDWALPDKALVCLVGRGDSTKSTILEALRCAFYPQWNLAFNDADFYQCVHANTIIIEVVLGDIPDAFRDLETYGHNLSGWDLKTLTPRSEPGDGLEDALRIRLTVAGDLEPSWRVVKRDDDEGVPFKVTDRARVCVSLIGAVSDRHLTWGRGSLLGNLTNSENLSLSLAEAGRAAKAAMEARRAESLGKFDLVARAAERTARSLGVGVASSYRAHLDTDAVSIHLGGLALHDGDMPLRQLGVGSKRMLTTALQCEAKTTTHVTLFDEVEVGLEPHRIARLLEHLKGDDTGQYILTTHSPVVLRELAIDDLHIVHCKAGRINVVTAAQPAIATSMQGKIRRGAEAFLAPKIVVCEGATEVGFIRGLDDHWISQVKPSCAYQGVASYDAGTANQVKGIAKGLRQLGYDVAVLADSDAEEQFSDKDAEELRRLNVTVVKWDDKLSLEERVFADLPWPGVLECIELAGRLHDRDRVITQIGTQHGSGFNRDPAAWPDTRAFRSIIGKAAKAGDECWFKRQDRAQEWAAIICRYVEAAALSSTDLAVKINQLRAWIDRA
jgi:putative ATP-dependent endonuclease of OLD family